MDVRLRELDEADLDQQFVWEQDPAAIAMAAFTRANPDDREAFDLHHARIREDPECNLLAIEDDDGFAGTIGSYAMHGEREVTYWVDRSRWGRGVASAALREFLSRVELTRPLYAGVAEHNIGSATVLERAGFVRVGEDQGYAGGVGREVVEVRFRLDR